MTRERGFTTVEAMVAVLVLTVGLLGLVGNSALVTRMVAGGQRTAAVATYASQRLEQLRTTACTAQTAGADTLYRGNTPIDINAWRFVQAGPSHWRIVLRATYLTQMGRWRTDSMETAVSCLR